MECATKNLQEMKAPTKPDQVHKVFRRRHPPVGKDVTCHRCGAPGHLATTCRLRDRTCYKCGKKGHLAKVCRSKPKTQPPPGMKQKRSPSAVRRVEEDSADDPSQPVLTVHGQGNCSPPIKVHVDVDNCSLLMEVDTGASVSIIAETTFGQLWPGGA